MTVNSIILPRWFDRHLHARDGQMLEAVLPCTLRQRARGAVFMGNLGAENATTTIERALAYRERIKAVRDQFFLNRVPYVGTGEKNFTPCMTLYLTDDITPEEVVRGYYAGAWQAVKLYLADQNGQGGTTGSQQGVRNLKGRYPVFAAMEENGIPLLGHFEAVEPEVDEFDREVVSLERDLMPILGRFPKLFVVFEHLTDGRAADFVADELYDFLFATVTAHHLIINRNALFKGGLCPVNYCKPVAKREGHRLRVRQYVTSGHQRFGAGTDSAPHDISAKSRPCGCAAGIFTSPHAVELYAHVFDEDDALGHLANFLSVNFIDIYGMKVSDEDMVVVRKPWTVPKIINGVEVFLGGTVLPWQLVG